MGALAALLAPSIISGVIGLIKDYQQGKITIEQLQSQIAIVVQREITAREEAAYDMVKTTFPAFMEAVKTSRIVRAAYFYVIVTQATVLLTAQILVPWLTWKFGGVWPSAGVTLDWGYGLLVLLCGGGIAAIKRPPPPK